MNNSLGSPLINVTRGVTPHFFTFHSYLLPLPPCSLRAANGRPYTPPLIHVAQVCHAFTCPYGQISSGEAGFHTRTSPLYFTHEVDFIKKSPRSAEQGLFLMQFYFLTAMASTSTLPPLGRAATCTQERAGSTGPLKYLA